MEIYGPCTILIKEEKGGKISETLQNYFENATKRIRDNCRRAGSKQNKITVTTIDISKK